MGAKGGTIILLTSYALLDKFKEAGSYSRFSNRMMFHESEIRCFSWARSIRKRDSTSCWSNICWRIRKTRVYQSS